VLEKYSLLAEAGSEDSRLEFPEAFSARVGMLPPPPGASTVSPSRLQHLLADIRDEYLGEEYRAVLLLIVLQERY
jgi:hypothetical protein